MKYIVYNVTVKCGEAGYTYGPFKCSLPATVTYRDAIKFFNNEFTDDVYKVIGVTLAGEEYEDND